MTDKFSYSDFLSFANVPRETFLRLEAYVGVLEKWQKTINLVGRTTVSDIWKRHIIDSIQLIKYIPKEAAVADIGSGAGFPGLVLAILGVNNMTLIESDARKVAFLREAVRITEAEVDIIHQRVEGVSLTPISVITARALAPIDKLLFMIEKTLTKEHNILLLKGKSYKEEIRLSLSRWAFDYEVFPSITDSNSAVLSLTHCTLVNPLQRR